VEVERALTTWANVIANGLRNPWSFNDLYNPAIQHSKSLDAKIGYS